MDRTRSARIVAALTTLLLAAALSGCSSSDGEATPARTSAPTNTPARDAGADQGRVFTADPTILRPQPIPITTWTPAGADRIAVGFQAGSPECYGVDASVTETARTVVVEVRSGGRADAVGRMCTMIAVFGTLEIPLKAPLGDRTVLSAV